MAKSLDKKRKPAAKLPAFGDELGDVGLGVWLGRGKPPGVLFQCYFIMHLPCQMKEILRYYSVTLNETTTYNGMGAEEMDRAESVAL